MSGLNFEYRTSRDNGISQKGGSAVSSSSQKDLEATKPAFNLKELNERSLQERPAFKDEDAMSATVAQDKLKGDAVAL